MSRIMLADDSTHAQRMGERILREEGYEVVSVTDGDTAVKRLADVDPDLIIADVFLPGKNGFELCRHVKTQPAHKHVRVVMTAGMLEVFDEEEARRAGADAIIKKPFESSVVLETIKPLIDGAQAARHGGAAEPEALPADFEEQLPEEAAEDVEVLEESGEVETESDFDPEPPPTPASVEISRPLQLRPQLIRAEPAIEVVPQLDTGAPRKVAIDAELVRAAVTLAVDEAMSGLIDDITDHVVAVLREKQ